MNAVCRRPSCTTFHCAIEETNALRSLHFLKPITIVLGGTKPNGVMVPLQNSARRSLFCMLGDESWN